MGNLKFDTCDKFFGEHGYTSTSANYLCNKAKELIEALSNQNINFLNTSAISFNNNMTNAITKGLDETALQTLVDNKLMEAKLKTLISWLREAIKAKENMLNIYQRTKFNDWMTTTHPEVDMKTYDAKLLDIKEPERTKITEEEWIMQNMDVKDINEYLTLLAMCSTLGKFVHPTGKFAEARNDAFKMAGTSKVADYNSNTLLYKYELSLPSEQIENTFFELQEKHRDYQKRLNTIKYRVENEIQKINDEYNKAYAKYSSDYNTNQVRISEARTKFIEEFENWKIEKLNDVRKQKIIIPNDLLEVVAYVNNVSKH